MYLFVSLFLYLQPIPVTLAFCEQDKLVFMQEEKMIEAAFFNVAVDEANWEKVCQYLEKSENIQIEKETLLNEENKEVYVFADQKLMQKIILENNWGRVLIRSPEYKYASLMIQEEAIQTASKPLAVITHKIAVVIVGMLFLLCMIVGWIFVKL